MVVPDAHADEEDQLVCENVLRKVLSWLDVPDLMVRAALVSTKWRAASNCKEVWRRRMHPSLLQPYSSSGGGSGGGGAAALASALTPAQLFHGVYRCNLLRNPAFLERLNGTRGSDGLTHFTWAPSHNPKGVSWEYPLLDTDLAALPAPGAKPFSTGCVAATGDWSEVTQVVDLDAALAREGVPAAWRRRVLEAGVPLAFSCLAIGSAAVPAEYQLVLVAVPAADAQALSLAELQALPAAAVPLGLGRAQGPDKGPGAEQEAAAARLRQLGLGASAALVAGPCTLGGDAWKQLVLRLPVPLAGAPHRIVVALRGRSRFWHAKSHHGLRFAATRLRYLPEEDA